MSLSNMQVYNQEIKTTTIELLGQKLNAFNQASGGAIVLDTSAWRGDYSKESFFSSLATAQRRVDRYAANGAQASTSLAEAEKVGVKVAGGFGPVLFEPSQLSYLEQSPADAIMAISEGFADALLADQLNTAVGAAFAAVSNNASVKHDISATAGVSQSALNASHAKFGDMSGLLVADIMNGATYHNLIGKALANGEQLFESTNVTVVNILGKIFVVSDIPALYEAGTPNKEAVLSVVNQGIVVDNVSDIVTNLQTTNGKHRIETTWQADYTFGIKLKGYSWDITNGGASPTDAELFTGSNWDKNVSSDKHTLGTVLISDADK